MKTETGTPRKGVNTSIVDAFPKTTLFRPRNFSAALHRYFSGAVLFLVGFLTGQLPPHYLDDRANTLHGLLER
jgi:hypothetical protein